MSLHAQADRIIRAPIGTVWAVLSDIERWPEWQSGVAAARCDGSLAPGVAFHWKAGGMAIRSVVETCVAPSEISWRGAALGSRAHHAWKLSLEGDVATRVQVEEDMEGWLVTWMKLFNRDFLQQGMDRQLDELVAEAERRHAAG